MDIAELDVLYRHLPSYQPEPAGDSMVVEEEMRAALSSMEPITFPAESVGEMTVVSLAPLVLVSIGLKVIISPSSLTLVVELVLPRVVTSPTSIVAGVLVSMKTLPWQPTIPRSSPTSAFVTSSTIITVNLVEILSSGITRSPGVIEAEKEFVTEMADSFYKSLKRSIALILEGSTISFSALKVVLSETLRVSEISEGMTKLSHWSFWWRSLRNM